MYLYNQKTKKIKSFKDLKSLLDFYEKLEPNERPLFLFWNFGCPNWTLATTILTEEIINTKNYKIPEFPHGFMEEQAEKTKSPISSEKKSSDYFKLIDISTTSAPKGKHKTDSDSQKSDPGSKQFQEQRKFKRFAVRLKVIITNKQKTFLSYSKNISIGGLLLEDRIPKYMFNEESEVYISAPNKKEIIAFRCTPIGDEDHPNRLRFEESQTQYIEKLKSWIENQKSLES